MRNAILAYLQSRECKMDARLFIETAYWRKFDKTIPEGACHEALTQLSKPGEDDRLPPYLVEFFRYVTTKAPV